MKIPKKDGTTRLSPNDDSVDNWEDILCDKCGKSCRDNCDMNFEYATIESRWGFGSKKDEQHHEGQVCETCYDGLGIKPTIRDYDDGAVCNCSLGSRPVVAPAQCELHGTRSYGGSDLAHHGADVG